MLDRLTDSSGPIWVDFLTYTYNKSLILTYDLASGGATVDSDLIAPTLAGVESLKDQVESEFIPTYASKPHFVPWSATDTLFAVFIGINDVQATYTEYAKGNWTRMDAALHEYAGLVDRLYRSGARNFLILNVPPLDKAPINKELGAKAVEEAWAGVAAWNRRLNTMAEDLTSKYHDSLVFVLDTNKLFDAILYNPRQFEQTRRLKNLTNYCDSYADGTPTKDTFYPICGVPVSQYFWRNSLHVSYPVHEAVAGEIVNLLNSRSGATSYGKVVYAKTSRFSWSATWKRALSRYFSL